MVGVEFARPANSRAARAVPSSSLAPWRAPCSLPLTWQGRGCVRVCACACVRWACVYVAGGWGVSWGGVCVGLACPARVRCVRCVQLHPTVSPYGCGSGNVTVPLPNEGVYARPPAPSSMSGALRSLPSTHPWGVYVPWQTCALRTLAVCRDAASRTLSRRETLPLQPPPSDPRQPIRTRRPKADIRSAARYLPVTIRRVSPGQSPAPQCAQLSRIPGTTSAMSDAPRFVVSDQSGHCQSMACNGISTYTSPRANGHARCAPTLTPHTPSHQGFSPHPAHTLTPWRGFWDELRNSFLARERSADPCPHTQERETST